LGQAAVSLPDCCPSNTVGWLAGGMAYGQAMKTVAVLHLKRLVAELKKRQEGHVNYNDLDSDLWGWYFVVPNKCLECSSLVAEIESKTGEKAKPEPKDCPRCHGTTVEPEFHEEAWVIHHQDHGYNAFYAIRENSIGVQLHIRRMPEYNATREAAAAAAAEICESIQQDCYEHPSRWLRCRDCRDEGFVLSLSYGKDYDGHYAAAGIPPSHECEATDRAIYFLDIVAEHFVCVVESLEKGEEP